MGGRMGPPGMASSGRAEKSGHLRRRPPTHPQTHAMYVTLRYTLEEDVRRHEMVKGWVHENIRKYLIVQHDKDEDVERTHWHVLGVIGKTIGAARESFKRLMGNLGSGGYQLKEVKDVEVFERYMCHAGGAGDTVQIVATSEPSKYTQEWAQDQNLEFYTKQKEFVKKKKKGPSLSQQLLNKCTANGVKTTRDVIKECYILWKETKALVNEFYMVNCIKTVCMQLNIGGYCSGNWCERIERDFFSRE